jgi:hypothetical protein
MIIAAVSVLVTLLLIVTSQTPRLKPASERDPQAARQKGVIVAA